MGLDLVTLKCECGHSFVASAGRAATAPCPKCGRSGGGAPGPTAAPAASAPPVAEPKADPAPAAPAPQAKVTLHCPSCKKAYQVPPAKPGTRVMCRTCKVPLVLPGPSGDPNAPPAPGAIPLRPVGEPVDPVTSALIPGYVIEQKIGEGGMGAVFLARQKSLDRIVAIKVLSPECATDPGYVARFLEESKAAAKLSHENIVGAVDAGESNGRPYFVMDYVPGETLQAVIKRDGPLPERQALEIARGIILGLRHAHQHGFIHRDIKPANIILGADGIAQICDFGLVRNLKADTSRTTPGVVYSSPSYASPEQCRAVELDHRSDMYSLGVTLFEMLTGRPPFVSDSPSALFVAHVTQAPPSPRNLNPSVSPSASQLVLRLLKKSADARYKTYDDLLTALEAVEHPPAAPLPEAPERSIPPPAPSARPGALKIGIGVAAGLVVVIGLVLALRPSSTRPGLAPRDPYFDKEIKDLRLLQEANWGKPSEVLGLRTRWKSLTERSRETPNYNEAAGGLLDFESRVAQEADRVAFDVTARASEHLEKGLLTNALLVLRSFPEGYLDSRAGARITTLRNQVELDIDQRFQEGKQAFFILVSSLQFPAARRKLDDLRGVVLGAGAKGPEFARGIYPQELDALVKKLDEEVLFAKRREAEAPVKDSAVSEVPAPQAPKNALEKPAVGPATAAGVPPAQAARPPATVKPAAPLKRPLPEASALKESESQVRDLFKEEYQRKLSSEKAALASKMAQLALQTNDDPAGRFVLYREARDLAAQGGDTELALRCIDALAKEFTVDRAGMKSVVLAELTRTAHTVEELKHATHAYLQLADEALADENYEAADLAAATAAQMARRVKEIPLLAKATAKSKECAELKVKFEKITRSKAALAKNPDDPDANLALGQHLCFAKGDWSEGLPHLAKSTDPALKSLAGKDLAAPSDAAEQMALGDSWWEVAGKRPEGKDVILQRARFWYEQGLPRLAEVQRNRVSQRLQELGDVRVDLLKVIDAAKDGLLGTWNRSGAVLESPGDAGWSRILIPYLPPEEYDLIAVLERKAGERALVIGLVAGGRQCTVAIDGWEKGDITGLSFIDGKGGNANDTTYKGSVLRRDTPTTIVCSVRNGGVTALADDKLLFQWSGNPSRLSLGGAWKPPRPDVLYLATEASRFQIRELVLVPITGEGRNLRR